MAALALQDDHHHITENSQHFAKMKVEMTCQEYVERYTKPYVKGRASMRRFSGGKALKLFHVSRIVYIYSYSKATEIH